MGNTHLTLCTQINFYFLVIICILSSHDMLLYLHSLPSIDKGKYGSLG